MEPVKNSIKLDNLIKDYKLLDENIFISRVNDIAEDDLSLVLSKIQSVLSYSETGIHLKYLLIKVIENNKSKKFIPILTKVLKTENKERIVWETLNAFVNIPTIESYKTLVGFFSEPKNKYFLHKFNSYLKIFYKKSPIIYHFDIFYRNRGDVKNIDSSGKFLIEHLNEIYVKDLLPAIYSKYENIREEALKIFEKRKSSLYFHNIDELFIKQYKSCELKYFKQITRTLFENALVSPHKKKILMKLFNYLDSLNKEKRNFFIIQLLRLDTGKIINMAIDIYGKLSVEDKLIFLNNLDPDLYSIYKFFIRELLDDEIDEKLLLKIIKILIQNKENDLLFENIGKQNEKRKELLINMIVETGVKGISDYLSVFLLPTEKNSVIFLVVGYIMNDEPDKYFLDFKNLLFSGVELVIKQRILRNIKKFNDDNIVLFIDYILDNILILKGLEKDFLLLIISLQERNVFNENLSETILNKVLMIMEESDSDGIINFVYFFDSFKIVNNKQKKLIVDELKMIQKTLLKSTKNDNTVSMIYRLIKKMENQ